MAGHPPASLIATAPSSVCPALVIVASPKVNESPAPLTFAVIVRSLAARTAGGRAPRKEARAVIEGKDAVKSPSTLGWSPSASEPPNASLAKGELSASTIGLGVALGGGLRIVQRASDRNGRLRHTADRSKRS